MITKKFSYELRVEDEPFLTGDEISVRVIFNNLTGRNFGGNAQMHEEYLSYMERTYNIQLRGKTLSHGFPGENAAVFRPRNAQTANAALS